MTDRAKVDGDLGVQRFPHQLPLAAARLDLEPLRVEHAEEPAPL